MENELCIIKDELLTRTARLIWEEDEDRADLSAVKWWSLGMWHLEA